MVPLETRLQIKRHGSVSRQVYYII